MLGIRRNLPRSPIKMKFFRAAGLQEILLRFEFYWNRLSGSEMCVVEICRFPSIWPNQWERTNFEPHSSETAQPILIKFEPNLRTVSWRSATMQNFISIRRRGWSRRIPSMTEKTISGVRVSPGSAVTLVRRGGIKNNRSIANSLSNTSAKNYQNRLMCVEIRVCNISVVFTARDESKLARSWES